MNITSVELGRRGEEIAAAFLEKKGYTILVRNYRYRRFEVDIIARLDKVLVVVEVKCRKPESLDSGYELSTRQMRRIISAANSFMFSEKNGCNVVRFDLILVKHSRIDCSNYENVEHIENAFYPV